MTTHDTTTAQTAGLDLPERGVLTIDVGTEHVDAMLHRASVDGFEFTSDEPEWMRGTDEHPYPLHYFVAGIGMCTVTQVVWFGRRLDVHVGDVTCRVKVHWSRSGSAKRGDLQTHCHGVETELDVVSDDPPERVAELVRVAEAACYARTAVREPVPFADTVTLNGEPLRVAS